MIFVSLTASGAKDSIIVTPLMEFVRQKRALKSMPQVHIFVLFQLNHMYVLKWCVKVLHLQMLAIGMWKSY